MARDSVKIAATFLASFAHFNRLMGRPERPATVTRQQLNEWHQVCVNRDNRDATDFHGGCNPDLPLNDTEPTTGLVKKWPNWLTNPPTKYRVPNQRGVFTLPWNMLDDYLTRKDNVAAKRAQYAAALAATKANAPAPAPVAQPTPEDQIDQDIEEDFEEYDGDDNDTEDGDN